MRFYFLLALMLPFFGLQAGEVYESREVIAAASKRILSDYVTDAGNKLTFVNGADYQSWNESLVEELRGVGFTVTVVDEAEFQGHGDGILFLGRGLHRSALERVKSAEQLTLTSDFKHVRGGFATLGILLGSGSPYFVGNIDNLLRSKAEVDLELYKYVEILDRY